MATEYGRLLNADKSWCFQCGMCQPIVKGVCSQEALYFGEDGITPYVKEDACVSCGSCFGYDGHDGFFSICPVGMEYEGDKIFKLEVLSKDPEPSDLDIDPDKIISMVEAAKAELYSRGGDPENRDQVAGIAKLLIMQFGFANQEDMANLTTDQIFDLIKTWKLPKYNSFNPDSSGNWNHGNIRVEGIYDDNQLIKYGDLRYQK